MTPKPNPEPPAATSEQPSWMPLEHRMNCPAPGNWDADCTCGLDWRIKLQTELEMHNAWRKRAEEAEAALSHSQGDGAQPDYICGVCEAKGVNLMGVCEKCAALASHGDSDYGDSDWLTALASYNIHTPEQAVAQLEQAHRAQKDAAYLFDAGAPATRFVPTLEVLPPLDAEQIIEIDEDGKVHGDISGLRRASAPAKAEGREPFAYACPVNCGCIWRDNHDDQKPLPGGTMSLFGVNSKSCPVCEPLPLDKMIPLYL